MPHKDQERKTKIKERLLLSVRVVSTEGEPLYESSLELLAHNFQGLQM